MHAMNPFETVMQVTSGYWVSRCLHVVADLGVADKLGDTPQDVASLAQAVGAQPDALGRVLRLLSSVGVFASADNGYAHTDASRLLRSDHPASLRAFVRMTGLPMCWDSYRALDSTVKTGVPAVRNVVGEPFAWFASHPEEAGIFEEAMTGKAFAQVAGVLAAYDFSSAKKVADIGGGRGHLLQAVLKAAPTARGVLFDLPHVIGAASALASDRLELQAGDFFKDSLPSCDTYLLMEVIHDWADPEAKAILAAVRKAAPSGAKLLLLETPLPATPAPHPAKALDVHMMVMVGGRERTEAEYGALLAASNFKLARAIPTRSGMAILEAEPC
jgi:hypothetical protein